MTQGPKRLIEQDAGFAHLVAASQEENPSNVQFEKALSVATQAAVRSPWTFSRWFGSSLVVGIAVGAAVFGVVAYSNSVSSRISSHASPNDVVTPSSAFTNTMPAPAEPVAAAPVRIEEPVLTVSVDDLASAPAVGPASSARLAARTGNSAQPAPAASQATFGEELALVSAARTALEARDVTSCNRAVERYKERFPRGLFAQEIEVVRIEALAASGEQARSLAAAETFLAANPQSPYADRVRSLAERTRH